MQPAWALPKLLWLLREHADLAPHARLAHQSDLVTGRLVGGPVATDLSNALKTGAHLIDEIWPEDQIVLLHRGQVRATGTIDEVVGQATDGRMPTAGKLQEAVRRRRAAGGPAEQTFATLVGLELRPRRLRDASTLWGSLRTRQGVEARDGVWMHPDLLPTAADLDDPLGFREGASAPEALTEEDFDGLLAASGLVGSSASGELALPTRMAEVNAMLDLAAPAMREALLIAFLDRLSRPTR